jgi:hypothetical protein
MQKAEIVLTKLNQNINDSVKNNRRAVCRETCKYGLEEDIWKPDIVIYSGAIYLSYCSEHFQPLFKIMGLE